MASLSPDRTQLADPVEQRCDGHGQFGVPGGLDQYVVKWLGSELVAASDEGTQVVDTLWVAKAEPDDESFYVPSGGCGNRAATISFQKTEVTTGAGDVDLSAQSLEDVEGTLVLEGSLVVVLAPHSEVAEIVVASGYADLVVESLADVEGALVLAGRLLRVPLPLGERTEAVVGAGQAG
jgi:hypothetical protein